MSEAAAMLPDDEFNRQLLANVHPPDWRNPDPSGPYNLVVVGGGTAGLIAASVAGSMGARTALIEQHLLGGDCLNVGCVPSKGIIRGARAQAEIDWITAEGLAAQRIGGGVDFSAVMERLRRIRAEISRHDGAARYRDEFGVDIFLGHGSFSGPREISVQGTDGTASTLAFSRALIATGARAAAPPINGLETTPYLTNETLFSLTRLPASLIIVGAGPIGCEMAQSFSRLGARVELVEMASRVLPREDPDAAQVVQQALERDGVELHLSAAVSSVTGDTGRVAITYTTAGDNPVTVEAEQLLVAIGRKPNLDGLGLDRAGVTSHPRGVVVNDFMQTSNRRIYAAGDIASPYQFTHMAEAAAAIVVQNALFVRSARMSRLVVPWSTYTSPELARVGLSEHEAQEQDIEVDIYRHELGGVDRARLDGQMDGFVKILTRKGSTRILGAAVVAEHAGEMIGELVLAMRKGLGVDDLAGVIHPYPTQAEAIKRAAAGYLRSRLTPRRRRLLQRWFRLRR